MTTLPDSAAPHAASRQRPRKPGWVVRNMLKLGAAAVFLVVAGFAAFSLYVSNLATPRDVAQADAIIVLTGGQARLEPALELLKAGKGTRLLISGVHPKTGPKTLSAATGNDRRLFNCCVDFDYAALDTTGNAEQSAIWVENHNYRSVILVTNNYHMPRTMLEMGRLIGDEAELRPYPVVNTKLDLGRVISEPEAFRVMFTEYAKYVAALARSAWPTDHATPGTATAMIGTADKAR